MKRIYFIFFFDFNELIRDRNSLIRILKLKIKQEEDNYYDEVFTKIR